MANSIPNGNILMATMATWMASATLASLAAWSKLGDVEQVWLRGAEQD
jgi:hypothetical protein